MSLPVIDLRAFAKDLSAGQRPVEEVFGTAFAAALLPASLALSGWVSFWAFSFAFARAVTLAGPQGAMAVLADAGTAPPREEASAPRLVVSNPEPAIAEEPAPPVRPAAVLEPVPAEPAREAAAETDVAAPPKPVKIESTASAKGISLPKLSIQEDRAAPGESGKPKGLAAARGGAPDDLKMIAGIGPKIERILHDLGIFHFDQVAAWTPREIAWIDGYLKFNGRVVRDQWIAQAAALAAGGAEEYQRRFGKPPR